MGCIAGVAPALAWIYAPIIPRPGRPSSMPAIQNTTQAMQNIVLGTLVNGVWVGPPIQCTSSPIQSAIDTHTADVCASNGTSLRVEWPKSEKPTLTMLPVVLCEKGGQHVERTTDSVRKLTLSSHRCGLHCRRCAYTGLNLRSKLSKARRTQRNASHTEDCADHAEHCVR